MLIIILIIISLLLILVSAIGLNLKYRIIDIKKEISGVINELKLAEGKCNDDNIHIGRSLNLLEVIIRYH